MQGRSVCELCVWTKWIVKSQEIRHRYMLKASWPRPRPRQRLKASSRSWQHSLRFVFPQAEIVCKLHIPISRSQYLFGDVAVLIDVVEVKGPVELLSDGTSEQHRQADDKVLEADRTVSVDVKRVEQEVSIGACVCGQKESGWGVSVLYLGKEGCWCYVLSGLFACHSIYGLPSNFSNKSRSGCVNRTIISYSLLQNDGTSGVVYPSWQTAHQPHKTFKSSITGTGLL